MKFLYSIEAHKDGKDESCLVLAPHQGAAEVYAKRTYSPKHTINVFELRGVGKIAELNEVGRVINQRE